MGACGAYSWSRDIAFSRSNGTLVRSDVRSSMLPAAKRLLEADEMKGCLPRSLSASP